MPSNKTRATQPCPSCGGTMKLKTKADRLQYKGHSRSIRTRGWWCDSCDEGILDAEALKMNERQIMELKAEVEGLLQPQEIAAIREQLQLSQRQAGEILGGGPRAFQKYESGQVLVSSAMSNLLRLLAKDPRRLKELDLAS